MGLLALGTPLPWSEAKQHADYVREHGIEQLLHIWHNLKDRTGDRLLWGDEVSVSSWTWTGSDRKTRGIASAEQEGRACWEIVRLCGQYARTGFQPERTGKGRKGSYMEKQRKRPSAADLSSLHLARQPPYSFHRRRPRKFPPRITGILGQIEYIVISYDDDHKNARLSLRQTEILQDLQADADERRRTPSREESPAGNGKAEGGEDIGAKVTEDGKPPQKKNELRFVALPCPGCTLLCQADLIHALQIISACVPVFHPEYGRYMLESTPGAPYGATLDDLLLVEGNMRFRCAWKSELRPARGQDRLKKEEPC